MNLAIFPLQLIVFPGEQVNLHIFELRYRHLFNELRNQPQLTFGIPPVINNEIYLLGTRLKLIDVVKEYETGEMDVITEGIDAFTIHEIKDPKTANECVYAEIELLDNNPEYDLLQFQRLENLYDDFQSLMPEQKVIKTINPSSFSFQIAHYIGLNEQQKIELLSIESEEERQETLIQHLQTIIPSMQSIRETQERIIANGHFKNLDSFKFQKPE